MNKMTLCCLLALFAASAGAEDRCLLGKWELVSETGKPAGSGASEAEFAQSGSLIVEFGSDMAPGESSANKRELSATYEDYEIVSSGKVSVVTTQKRMRVDGSSAGSWFHPSEGRVNLSLQQRLDVAYAMKTQLPDVPERPWQEMGVQPANPPHRNSYDYSCSGGELVLKKAAHAGLGLRDYSARFERR